MWQRGRTGQLAPTDQGRLLSAATVGVAPAAERARDALPGGPVTMIDEGIDVSEDRVQQRMGELLANVIM